MYVFVVVQVVKLFESPKALYKLPIIIQLGMGLLDTDSKCVQCSRRFSCWTQTASVYSVAGNGLLDTDGDCVQCSREISCWTETVTLYCVVGNGIVGH